MKIFETSLFRIIEEYSCPPVHSVLQVGASGGQEISFFRENGVQSGLFIEPLDFAFKILEEQCKKFSNFFPLNALALSADAKMAKLHIASNGGMSSSVLEPKGHIESYPHVNFLSMVELIGYSLDTLVWKSSQMFHGCPSSFDLIYMDVQGAELEVFKGASSQLQSAKYIFTEVGLGGGYQGDVDLETLIGFLKVFGFRLIGLEVGVKTGYGNGLFVRL